MRLFTVRNLLILGGGAATIALLGGLLAPVPLETNLAQAKRGPMTVTVSGEGWTRVKDEYEVAAPIGGRLLRSAFKAGDPVKAGQVVAVIEPPQPQFHDFRSQEELQGKAKAAEALHSLAVADLERTRAEHEYAKRKLDRSRVLTDKNVVSTGNLDEAERDARTREAAVFVAENVLKQRVAELEAAKAALAAPRLNEPPKVAQPPVEVVSPVSGRVLLVMRESETIVTPGMPIMKIGDITKLEVMLEMLSENAVKAREGAPAVLDGWGGKQLNARVRRIEPFGYTKISALGIEEQRVKVLLDFTDAPSEWQMLGTGFRMTAHIVTWQAKDVLKIPVSALFRDGNRWAAFVVSDHRAHLQHLAVGHINDTEAEILSGLTEKAEVILNPSDRITDGAVVRPAS